MLPADANAATRRTWAEINLDAISQNVRALSALAATAAVMTVVKADGYGNGALQIAQTALQTGAT